MPSASIQSLVNSINPIIGASRDDLVVGDVVTVSSVNVHSTYSWTFIYRPVGSTAAFSGVVTNASPGDFTVDVEGPYLIRLTADLGLITETTQYVRLRYLTVLGELHLVAAGEGYGGAIPVPVDQTPTGWTDALNTNLMTLLGLVGRVSSSSNILNVDLTPGFGDYTSIQAAIDAAVTAGASVVNPYTVLVHPGTYVEDLTFAPSVYVAGWPGTPADAVGFPLVLVRGAHTVSTPGGTDNIIISRMDLSNVVASANATVYKTGSGSVTFHQCVLEQGGLDAGQGPALRLSAGTAILVECTVVTTNALPDDRAAIEQPTQSTLVVTRSSIIGPTGLVLNTSGDTFVVTSIIDSDVTGQGATGFAIVSDATGLLIQGSQVASVNATTITVHPGAGAFANDQDVTILRSVISGQVVFDVTGIVGSTALSLGASEYGDLVYPGGALTAVGATTKSTSLFYDNTSSGIVAENVQDAIDEVHDEAVLVRTLDDAYNGGVPLSGSGRTIIASAGSVQIVDAAFPSDPPPAGNTDAQLDVVSAVRIGAIGFPEVDIDPNPYGSGPSVVLGNRVVPGNIPWGAGTARVMGRSTGDPLYRNYNLRLQTQSSVGGGSIGRLIVQGGDAYDNGVATPDAASVYIEAGSAFDVTGSPGNIFLSPGQQSGGFPGYLILATMEGASGATLTASGACANPIGVTGSITFATDMGAVTLDVAAADTRAAVVAALDALDGISAVASGGGVITITTDHLGPNAEVYFLSATAGVDVAIGGFDGVSQVDGAYARSIDVQVSADQEVSFGANGITGPLVYNADTGKLTVPGLIDPTGLVLEEAAAPSTGGTEGALFVSDGTGGLVVGSLYYRGPSDAVPSNISAVVGTPDLASVLLVGNTTGGVDIVVSSGDKVVGEGGVGIAGDVLFQGGTATGGGATVGGQLLFQPGAGFGGGGDGCVVFYNAAGTQGVRVTVTAADTISFDTLAGGGMPLVYDTSTGKLTVPGLIDPTGIVLTHAAAPTTGLAEGALFISDGTGGLTAGALYYQGASSGTPTPFSGGAFEFPRTAAPSQTADGAAVWDSNDFLLTVGTGSGRKTMVDTDSTQSLSTKTLVLPAFLLDDANNTSVQDVITVTHTTSGVAAPSIGAGILFRAEGATGVVANVARVAGYLADTTPGAEAGALGFYTRIGGSAVALRWEISGSGNLTPADDAAVIIGDSTHRVLSLSTDLLQVFSGSGDANAVYSAGTGGFQGGAGGGSALDVQLTRISGPLWSMTTGLRVDGDVTRLEGSILFGTTRTASGGGSDSVTVKPADAVAAADSAQSGSALNLLGSNAAATGPGNFSAAGGGVAITAGAAAAVNVAQVDGVSVTITGGDAASGGGGAAAKGGGVVLEGAAGVAGGDGGDVIVQPGPLNGAGADGSVIFSINGASRTPTLVPRATAEGSIGSTSLRWGTLAFQDENSTGKKLVGFVSKVFSDSPYTVASTDYIILYDPTGGSSVVNLPAAASSTNRVLYIKHSSSTVNTVTVDGDGSETIDGSLTILLGSYQSLTLISNGSNWFIL